MIPSVQHVNERRDLMAMRSPFGNVLSKATLRRDVEPIQQRHRAGEPSSRSTAINHIVTVVYDFVSRPRRCTTGTPKKPR
jgi:hypothetical protein